MPRHKKPTCAVIRPSDIAKSKQGLACRAGVSAESAGARRICMHLVTIPPGTRARAHKHDGHESAIYVLSGVSEVWYGQALGEHAIVRAGDFLYIPAGVPHLPGNPSATEPCVAVIARTDPNEQESTILLPELEPALHLGLTRPGREPAAA